MNDITHNLYVQPTGAFTAAGQILVVPVCDYATRFPAEIPA